MNLGEEIIQLKKDLAVLASKVAKLEQLIFSNKSNEKPVPKQTSVKEFILQKNPKDEIQKTLTIGYFLEKYEKLPTFNVKDLAIGFERAKEKIPSNINDKVNKNIAKGYMMEAQERKDNFTAWILTNSGEKFVDQNFKEER